jgi:hypothetical protein
MQRRDDFKFAGRLPGRHGPGTASPRGANVAKPRALDQRFTDRHDAMIKMLTSNLVAGPVYRAYIFWWVGQSAPALDARQAAAGLLAHTSRNPMRGGVPLINDETRGIAGRWHNGIGFGKTCGSGNWRPEHRE